MCHEYHNNNNNIGNYIQYTLTTKKKERRMQTGQGSCIFECNNWLINIWNDIKLLCLISVWINRTAWCIGVFLLLLLINRRGYGISLPCVPKEWPKKGECEKAVFYGWSNFPVKVYSDILQDVVGLLLPFFFVVFCVIVVVVVVVFECFCFHCKCCVFFVLTRHQHTHTMR